MTGINYNDTVILYNRYENYTLGKEYYFGTRFDNVRVELTQGANIQASGLENADSCKVKITNEDLPKPYLSPEIWNGKTTEEMAENFTISSEGDFFVIVKKDNLAIDITDLPVGLVEHDSVNGFFEYVKNRYGNVYSVHTIDVYDLIPRFEIGGR